MSYDEDKRVVYNNALYRYGFLCLLYLMQNAEEREKYEDARIVLGVIKHHNDKYDMKLPEQMNSESIADYIQGFWELGYAGTTAIKNMPSYVQSVEEEIMMIDAIEYVFRNKERTC